MNKTSLIWSETKAWCIANPEKRAAIAMIDGQFEITWNPRKPLAGVDPVFYDQQLSINAILETSWNGRSPLDLAEAADRNLEAIRRSTAAKEKK